jgi:hypothetical protein
MKQCRHFASAQLLLAFAFSALMPSSSPASEPSAASLGKPTVFWHDGQWETFVNGQWQSYYAPAQQQPASFEPQVVPVYVPTPFYPTNDSDYSDWYYYPSLGYGGRRPHRFRDHDRAHRGGSSVPASQVAGLGQTTIGIGQPNGGIGQPNVGIGQTTIGIGQTTIGIGQPMGTVGRRNVELGRNNTTPGQTTIGIGQPNNTIPQPATAAPAAHPPAQHHSHPSHSEDSHHAR